MTSSPRFSHVSKGEDTMSITVDQTLLDAAQRIAPMIRAHSQEAEHRGRSSKPALDALACARIIEEVSRADSAAGWSVVNPVGWAWFCARLPNRGVEDIFGSNPNALIAGPFHPPMQATPVEGGYRLTGRAP